MITPVINDFNALFTLVCSHHTGPIIVDFGRQMRWDSITAGQCTQHVKFIQTDGINAFLDSRTHKIIFSEGTAEKLHDVLEERLMKA